MSRITEKMLQIRVDYLNKLTNSPMNPWVKRGDTGLMMSCIGSYHLSHAYGGVCLERMSNEVGGVTTPLMYGHVTKREAFEQICAFIRGIEEGKGLV